MPVGPALRPRFGVARRDDRLGTAVRESGGSDSRRTHDGTPLGGTAPSSDYGDDVAATRVDAAAPTLPRGSAADPSTGDVVIHVGHELLPGEWLIQL
jgi:hypothetical protein